MRWIGRGFLCLVLTISTATADPVEKRFRDAFEHESAAGVVAMTAGYVLGDAAPVILVNGPRYKGSEQMLGPEARWHVGSITKSFTATLLVQMAERGEINFDAPLAGLLPEHAAEMHSDWHDLTLTELLSHTAGLRPNFTIRQMVARTDEDHTAERLKRLRAHWGKALPGPRGQFGYSNIGYVLAGFVAETRAGMPWQVLIRRDIAVPLGLKSLGFGPPAGEADPWGHKRQFFIIRPVQPAGRGADNPAWLGPAGILHMSLADLLGWGQAHMRACRGEMPEFLSAEACTRLHTPIANDYALGWAVQPPAGLDALVHSHNGSNTMWVAELAFLPEHDMVLALAMNQARLAEAGAAMTALRRAILGPDQGRLAPAPAKP